MKTKLLVGIFILAGVSGRCEETTPTAVSAVEKAAETTPPVTASSNGQKTVSPTSESPAPVESATPENTAAPVAAAAAVAESPAVSVPASSTALKAEPLPAAEKSALEPVVDKSSEEKPVGRVVLLQKIADFHEKEKAAVKEMIERWNVTLRPHLARQQTLRDEEAAKKEKMVALESQGTKAARKEAKGLKKEIAGIEKLIQGVQKDIAGQYKSISTELKLKAGSTEKLFQDTVRTVIDGLQGPPQK